MGYCKLVFRVKKMKITRMSSGLSNGKPDIGPAISDYMTKYGKNSSKFGVSPLESLRELCSSTILRAHQTAEVIRSALPGRYYEEMPGLCDL